MKGNFVLLRAPKLGLNHFGRKKILIEIAIILQYSLCDEFEHLPLEGAVQKQTYLHYIPMQG